MQGRRTFCAMPTQRCIAPRRKGRHVYEIFDSDMHVRAVDALAVGVGPQTGHRPPPVCPFTISPLFRSRPAGSPVQRLFCDGSIHNVASFLPQSSSPLAEENRSDSTRRRMGVGRRPVPKPWLGKRMGIQGLRVMVNFFLTPVLSTRTYKT